MNKDIINIEQITDIANKSEAVGDELLKRFDKEKSLEIAKVAINAFRNTLYAHSLLIKNKRL